MRGKKKMTQQNKKQPRGVKKVYAFSTKRSIDLSLSENPLGCSPVVAEKLKQSNFAFNDYPTPNGINLKKALAKKFDCQEQNLFICNGSETIINFIPKVFIKTSNEVIVPALTFPLLSICSELAGLKVELATMDDQLGIDLTSVLKLINQKTQLIFICNPNNPTGSVIPKQKLTAFIEKVPASILVVVDEANIEFGGESIIELALSKPNLMVLRTFSKGFGLSSLRIGFAVANPDLIAKLEEETPVFPISGLSEELAISALKDDDFIAKTKIFIEQQRNIIKIGLEKLGFKIFPSQANNLFVKLPDNLSPDLFRDAMEEADISLVKGSSFDGFDNSFFRVSPRLEKVNRAFLKAVNKLVNQSG